MRAAPLPLLPDGNPMSPRLMLAFAVVTLIWGSTWLIIKTQLGVVLTSWSVAWRFLAGGSLMLGVCQRTSKPMRLGWRGHGFALVIGMMQFVLNYNFVYRAEETVTSGLVAMAFALLIVPKAIFARIFLG